MKLLTRAVMAACTVTGVASTAFATSAGADFTVSAQVTSQTVVQWDDDTARSIAFPSSMTASSIASGTYASFETAPSATGLIISNSNSDDVALSILPGAGAGVEGSNAYISDADNAAVHLAVQFQVTGCGASDPAQTTFTVSGSQLNAATIFAAAKVAPALCVSPNYGSIKVALPSQASPRAASYSGTFTLVGTAQ